MPPPKKKERKFSEKRQRKTLATCISYAFSAINPMRNHMTMSGYERRKGNVLRRCLNIANATVL